MQHASGAKARGVIVYFFAVETQQLRRPRIHHAAQTERVTTLPELQRQGTGRCVVHASKNVLGKLIIARETVLRRAVCQTNDTLLEVLLSNVGQSQTLP